MHVKCIISRVCAVLTNTRLVAKAGMKGIVIRRKKSTNLLQAPNLEFLRLPFNHFPATKRTMKRNRESECVCVCAHAQERVSE